MKPPFKVGVYLDVARGYGREVALGIAEYAAKSGRWVFAGGGDVFSLADKIRAGNLDGIIARIPDESAAAKFAGLGIPVVDVYGQCRIDGVSSVECDSRAIAAMAAKWFLSRRYTNFAFVGFKDTAFSALRRDTFQREISAAGFKVAVCEMPRISNRTMPRVLLEAEKFGPAADERRLASFLAKLPERTAVFCANDFRAYNVLHAAESAGIAVPEHIAVMGVDDDPILCTLSSPGITSIDPDAHNVGYQGARLLEALMRERRAQGGAIKPMRRRIFPPRKVVERGSTDFDPIDPPWLRETIRYAREHIADGINAGDLINFAAVSHTTMENAFRQSLGSSPHKYLAELRLAEAARLLRETDAHVSQIAAQTGFASVQYFCRTFLDWSGQSPGEWRKLQKV